MKAFNRTSMELKRGEDLLAIPEIVPFNRTSMELKQLS